DFVGIESVGVRLVVVGAVRQDGDCLTHCSLRAGDQLVSEWNDAVQSVFVHELQQALAAHRYAMGCAGSRALRIAPVSTTQRYALAAVHSCFMGCVVLASVALALLL